MEPRDWIYTTSRDMTITSKAVVIELGAHDCNLLVDGAAERIRTSARPVRSRWLISAELRPHVGGGSGIRTQEGRQALAVFETAAISQTLANPPGLG